MNLLNSNRTKTRTLTAIALFLTGVITSPAATLAPSSDTYLTEHSSLGGSSSNHSSDTLLYSIGAASFLSYPLLQFNLTPFSGQTVVGDATLSLYVDSAFNLATTRTVTIHEVLTNWAAATVTYDSFGPAPGVQFGSDVTSSIASLSVGGAGMVPQYVSWTIPGAVIQNWIANPDLNKGLLVNNQVGQDLNFTSVEGANDPQLVFTVPEPSTMLFGAIGLCAFALRRNRNTRSA